MGIKARNPLQRSKATEAMQAEMDAPKKPRSRKPTVKVVSDPLGEKVASLQGPIDTYALRDSERKIVYTNFRNRESARSARLAYAAHHKIDGQTLFITKGKDHPLRAA